MSVRLSAFPKCYLDDIVSGSLSVFDWIKMARELPAQGLEMYSGFLSSTASSYLDRLGEAITNAGFAMPMLCCSPDFTNPDPGALEREIDRQMQMISITRHLGGPRAVCRVLSGQRYPEVTWEQGREWVVTALECLIPVARQHDIILGLENHYKDGYWRYPEFAQKMDRFVSIVEAIPDRSHFGVQYDPSNALVAGDDPIALLERVAPRVVSMHASDRYLAPGVTLDSLHQTDGTLGYSPHLLHGVTGRGLNDYPRIFQILAAHHYTGWISIEDGMNGMQEMAASLDFLQEMTTRYFP